MADLAVHGDIQPGPASGVQELDSVLVAVESQAPVRERDEQREQFPAPVGEHVLVAGACSRIPIRLLCQQLSPVRRARSSKRRSP
jgi:hypothetical protein